MGKRTKLDEVAEYYETHDTSAELEQAELVPAEPTGAEAMVTYALRVPKPVMDQLRETASTRGVRVTALMRQWLEERLASEMTATGTNAPDAVVKVGDLLAFAAEHARRLPAPRETQPAQAGPVSETPGQDGRS